MKPPSKTFPIIDIVELKQTTQELKAEASPAENNTPHDFKASLLHAFKTYWAEKELNR